MKKLLFSNIAHKLAAGIIAVLLFLMVQNIMANTPSKSFRIRVVAISPPSDLAIPVLPEVDVEASFLGPELLEINSTDIQAEVDLRNAQPGTKSYPVRVRVPEKIKAFATLSAIPDKIEIKLERRISKTLKVEAEPEGDVPAGFSPKQSTIAPEEVTVSGSETMVARAKRARIFIDGSKLKPGAQIETDVQIFDSDGRPMTLRMNPSKVTFIPMILGRIPMTNLLISPRWLGAPQFGFRIVKYELSQTQVRVKGDANNLAGLQLLETEPIDIREISATKTFEVRLVLPTGISIEAPTPIRITVTIERVPTGDGT